MERLKCPVCGKRINLTLEVPADHSFAKAAVCSNEYGFHVGLIYYKFLNVKEEAAQPLEHELILN